MERNSRFLMIARSIGITTSLYLFLVTGLAKKALSLPTPTIPSPLIPSRIIASPGFEQPVIKGIGVAVPEGYGTTPPTVWQTTEDRSPYINSLEYWRGTGGGQSPSRSGQYVELNAASNSAIYQDICVLQNETVDWSLFHAVRKASVANDTNIMRVTVSDPTLWIGKTPPSVLSYSSPNLITSFNDGWQQKTGSYTHTGASARLRFAFNAIQGSIVGTTRNISHGNFLDDVALSLAPVIDFLPTDVTNQVNLSTTAEGNGGSPYYLSLRLNGRLKSSATITIALAGLTAPRNFTVGTPLQGAATANGLSAIKSGSSITLTLPAGDYDPNNITKYVHIPIDFGDLVYQPSDNVGFSLTSATGGGSGTIAIGSSACETARTNVPVVTQEDDIRQIKGRIFEDINYGGGAGRSFAVGGTPVLNARVELYNNSGDFVTSTNTDNNGAYEFDNLPTSITYYTRVANNTITSNRLLNTPTTDLLPVQTFRSDATTGVAVGDANRVGGENPSVVDALSGSSGSIMSSAGLFSGNLTGQAQSIATVAAGTANISNLDFGYNFDTIVNTNDAGQGSLRQFIVNSNALNNNNLAQVGQLSGKEVSIFMIPIPSGSPPGGLRSGLIDQLTAGRALISLASPLIISDTDTSIDGRTQTTNVGNSNSVVLGSGGLVGVDNLSLAQLNAPEVELINSGSIIHGIIVDGANATIQGIAIHGFGTVGNNQGDILLQATNPLVTQNAIGFTATSFTAPTANQSQSGIVVNGSTNATITNNIIGFTNERGILGGRTSMNLSGLVIRENEIKQPGNISGTVGQHSAIELFPSTTGNVSITRNLLTDSQADSGIAIRPAVIGTSSSFLVQNNSILRNGAGNASGFGILLQASTTNSDLQGIKIDKNILNQNRRGIDSQQTAVTISGNVVSNSLGGYGVAIEAGKQKNKITQNSIFGNVGIGIDLGNTANGITPNNGTVSTTISNQDLDYPLITSAMLSSGTLTTKGYVGNNPAGNTTFGNLILEFFIADNIPADQNGEVVVGDTRSKPHGEGKTYIGSCTTDANGIFGNSTNPCVFSNAGTLGLTAATNITATATDSNGNTSEFSASPSSRANLVLVKRITAITSAATGLTTSYNSYIHESGSTKDNDLGWPTNYLLGEINPGQVRPGDEVEYTIYYLNNGENRIGQAKVCDALNKNLDFVLNFNSSNVGKGILLSPSSSTNIYLTNTSGDDRGEYSTTSPTDCNLVGNVTADQSTNTVVVNAASSSNPILGGAYGFIKFKVKVKS